MMIMVEIVIEIFVVDRNCCEFYVDGFSVVWLIGFIWLIMLI